MDEPWAPVTQPAPMLADLCLSHDADIGDAAVLQIARNCPNLRRVDLSGRGAGVAKGLRSRTR